MREPIVFVDVETGGVEYGHPDIQLAAVAMRDWQEVASFERKIHFDVAACDPAALELNSYDAETWEREAVDEVVAVDAFAEFVKPFCWVEKLSKRGNPYTVARIAGHNVSRFDAKRLRWMFKRHDRFLPVAMFEPLDTWQRALWYFAEHGDVPQPSNYKLTTLCEYFDIPVPSGTHDALVDARLTVELARRLCE